MKSWCGLLGGAFARPCSPTSRRKGASALLAAGDWGERADVVTNAILPVTKHQNGQDKSSYARSLPSRNMYLPNGLGRYTGLANCHCFATSCHKLQILRGWRICD